MAFVPVSLRISEPDKTGRRVFQAYLAAVNFDAPTTYGYKALFPQYKNLLVRAVSVEYAGTVGTEIAVGLAIGSSAYTLLPHAVVTRATADVTLYQGLYSMIGTPALLPDELVLYFFAVGYAATDDVYISIDGECW